MNLKFFNHASIAITDNCNCFGLITDPWISSPAFGGWEPFPKLHETDLERFVDTLEDYAIVISHGHDDHCDDSYIKAKLKPSCIFIPKLSTPGFLYRVRQLCSHETKIIELEHGKSYKYKDFDLIATINPDFTNNDAIIAIKYSRNTVVHANDNWHKQPDHILNLLKHFSKGSDITYLAQIGIAGSFPLFYLNLSNSEKKSLIDQQLRLQADSLEINACSIGALRAYSYANESQFTYLDSSDLYSRKIRNNILDDCITQETIYKGELANTNSFKLNKLNFCNMRIDNPVIYRKVSNDCKATSQSQSSAGFVKSFTLLNDQINDYLNKSKIEGVVALSAISYDEVKSLFGSNSNEDSFGIGKNKTLYIYSTYCVWEKILSGDLTLECITIGGCGLLKKSESSWNAKFVHDALSRFGYRYQAMTKLQKKTAHQSNEA